MKKRILSCLILVLCIVLSCFALTSCKKSSKDSTSTANDGKDGVGVQSVTMDVDGNLVITFTDGTTQTVTMPENESTADYSEGLHFQKINGEDAYRLIGIGIASDINIVIPSTYKNLPVTEISDTAFSGNTDIVSVSIPGSVTTIGEGSFASCSNLQTVTMAEGVTYIEDGAFYNCTSLYSVTLPNSLYSIGQYAFDECSYLYRINVGSGLRQIENSAFENCTNLEEVNITDIASWCQVEFLDTYSNPLYYANDIYVNDSLLTSLVIPEGVTSVNSMCFAYCQNLNSVSIPTSVINLGLGAFEMCTNLQTVTLAEGLEVIGDYAFYECGIVNITLPQSLTTIGEGAFEDCDSLTFVELPVNLSTLKEDAFCDCDALLSVAIPASVTNLYSNVFYGCDNLTIFTTASTTPYSWYSDWNSSNRPVVWNWTGTEITYRLFSNGTQVGTLTGRYSVELPTYTLDGYVHVGWYNNMYNTGTLYTAGYYSSTNTDLYAYWMTQEDYDAYYADGSSFERALTAYVGESYYINITTSGQQVYYKFVPTTTAYYKIYSYNNHGDSKVFLYDSSYNLITSDDDGYGSGSNFKLVVELQAGVTYYIGAAMWSSNTGYYDMYVAYN